jgi:hypothetical protein
LTPVRAARRRTSATPLWPGPVQQSVELAAALGRELAGEQQLDVLVSVGERGRDHPCERVDGRTQQSAGAQVLGDEDDQRCGGVMFDGALHEPARELLAIAVIDAHFRWARTSCRWSLRVCARAP